MTGFFDKRTFSVQYVVADPATKLCAIIDPVLDFDEKSGATSTVNADNILLFVKDQGPEGAVDPRHAPHADHFSAASYLKAKTGAPIAIGEKVRDVQKLWKGFYNWPDFPEDGSQWDKLFADGETFMVGDIAAHVMLSPGDTRIFTGHDYQPGGRAPMWESTLIGQKAKNTHMLVYKTEADFIAAREARDATLPMPRLILHALQINNNAGRLPESESNGRRYLKIPLDLLQAPWE